MADLIFNIAKGKIAEYAARVNANDPTNSALVIVALDATGLVADAVMVDYDTLDAVLTGASNEATNTGYARIPLDNTGGITVNTDDAGDEQWVDIPNQTFSGIAADGGGDWGALLVCYDSDTTGGTDANIVPISKHDFAVSPDGSDIVVQIPANGVFAAT